MCNKPKVTATDLQFKFLFTHTVTPTPTLGLAPRTYFPGSLKTTILTDFKHGKV